MNTITAFTGRQPKVAFLRGRLWQLSYERRAGADLSEPYFVISQKHVAAHIAMRHDILANAPGHHPAFKHRPIDLILIPYGLPLKP